MCYDDDGEEARPKEKRSGGAKCIKLVLHAYF